jgi:Ca-activated chloride channel family protein
MQIAVASWWSLGLLAAAPVVWLLSRHNRAAISRRRIRLATWLRASALCLLIAALMAPSLRTRTHQLSVVYALDISRSISPDFLRGALEWMREANARYRPAQARYLVFADRAELLAELDAIPSVAVRPPDTQGQDSEAIDQNATNLEQALSAALLAFAPEYAKRLVLMSDGNQTDGDVWRAVPRLRSERVRVFTLPATVALEGEAWIDEVEVPEGVRQQEPVTLRLRVLSRGALRATVQIAIAGEVVGSRNASLAPGENELSFPVRFKRAGENAVVAKLALEGERAARGDSLSETVWVRPRPRVLYVDSSAGAARYLPDALTLQGIDVRAVTPEQFAGDARALQRVDAVILSDVPADRLGTHSARRLEAFVRDLGGGLVFAAGQNTYGKEGYAKGEVERLLPVRFEARRKRRELDLVLLIDRSFSMRGRKLELAKSAALATLDLLEEQHRLAVIGFDSKPHEVVALAEVGSKRRAEELISSMTSSGQTNIYDALWRAYQLLG